MAFDSYLDFCQKLEESGELLRCSDTVATELEVTAFADLEMKSEGGGRALLFEKPTRDICGDKKVAPFPLAINSLGSWERIRLAMAGRKPEEIAAEIEGFLHMKAPTNIGDAWQILRKLAAFRHLKPRKVSSGIGTWNDYVYFQDPLREATKFREASDADFPDSADAREFSLDDLPITKCWPEDGGAFITLPMVHTADPLSKTRNVGMYRMQQFSPFQTGMHWQLHKVAARHHKLGMQRGEPLPVAVCLGGDPAYTLAAVAPLPDGVDELQFAAYLRRKSIPMRDCLTLPMSVPADVDFVLEGVVFPDETRPEGKFGDHTGFYTPIEDYPLFRLSAISFREHAIYPATIVGKPPMEDFYMGTANARIFMPILKANFPEIVDIALPAEGVFHNLLFVSIKKQYPYQAFKIMHGLWGMGQMMFTKYIIVVDDDCDVQNTSDVLFHLGANTDPARDISLIKAPCDALDHAPSHQNIGSHLGVDATKKLAGEGYQREWPKMQKIPLTIINKIEKLRNRLK